MSILLIVPSKDSEIIECIHNYSYLCTMKNPFYNDIYEILRPKGREGLPVGVIAKQVYNRHAGLFNDDLFYERIYQNVRFFLWAQSTSPSTPFTWGKSRGWYALKPNTWRQLQLDFTSRKNDEEVEIQEKKPAYIENYPSLF